LSTKGLVEKELSLSFDDLQKLPQVQLNRDFSCVTSWSIRDVVWKGVPFRALVKLTGVKADAQWVMFHCADGYTAPVPLEDAVVDDSLIAFKMNGKPIPIQQGFPARPFIPHLYGWKSAKWLTGVEFLSEYEDGYWENFGYHERGNIWDQERFKGQGGKHVRHKGLGSVPV
jgi:DMSO/TMAO reductase YedYZ molybdopterin-dependent catalytic subunit